MTGVPARVEELSSAQTSGSASFVARLVSDTSWIDTGQLDMGSVAKSTEPFHKKVDWKSPEVLRLFHKFLKVVEEFDETNKDNPKYDLYGAAVLVAEKSGYATIVYTEGGGSISLQNSLKDRNSSGIADIWWRKLFRTENDDEIKGANPGMTDIDSGYAGSNRKIRRKLDHNAEIKKVFKDMPTKKTASLTKLMKYLDYTVPMMERIFSFFMAKTFRDMRFRRQMLAKKNLRAICLELAGEPGTRTLIAFGNWGLTTARHHYEEDSGMMHHGCPSLAPMENQQVKHQSTIERDVNASKNMVEVALAQMRDGDADADRGELTSQFAFFFADVPPRPRYSPSRSSVLKSRIKRDLALDRHAIYDRSREPDSNGEILSISERQMHILERATANMNVMTPALVASMELHCRDFATKAANNEDMVYGM
ncbi:hypothetical protein PHYSODRAFT_334155 [Phytophthora sojae]|uniref:Uncharacterized protein n=1 Tax=Phytophthora sojae (strain P6497) TaxID=1094619 RepID=G4ZLB7_PHYSP|nr:hypothetical protein PHYSODRAFT_334155 [Phytophthora sojae]EGZ15963.1 hypothetical protein PHYSODRAFT_334155 [Phytophthora sojae]|eukprot:XP_009529712.1 hypothetical protein PHYSODRAFT_334155 [Phytophthora sojae]